MAGWRERQRRRRKRLLALALLAAVGASAFWFRSTTGHFPWSPLARDTRSDASRTLAGVRNTTEQPAMTPVSNLPETRPSAPVAPSPQPPAEQPPPRPAVPTTLPSIDRPANADPAKAAGDLKAGLEALNKGDLIAARQLLSRACKTGLPPADDRQAREKLADLANQTLFSKRFFRDDPLAASVTIQPGDTLGKLAGRYRLTEDLLALINGIQNKNLIRLGQRLKVVHGPWHAVVSKTRHTMDVYLQDKYIRSFPVALGMDGSTPTGLWKIANSQQDPAWTDPRTGHRWHSLDPDNPIGEYWIGLEGIDGEAVGQAGYGIHGTIEPETIGKDVSMGCIRMLPDDVALAYKLLLPGQSYVFITD